eukprot:GHVU01079803.1.p2 GENE.GHVU01079803.1~~GHVU01079803.1.p2  ORF type:complete len:127 (-),score=0.35 GHVU01079803.1:331-711(-)
MKRPPSLPSHSSRIFHSFTRHHPCFTRHHDYVRAQSCSSAFMYVYNDVLVLHVRICISTAYQRAHTHTHTHTQPRSRDIANACPHPPPALSHLRDIRPPPLHPPAKEGDTPGEGVSPRSTDRDKRN